MPGQELTMRAALGLLGVAEGADRDTVTRAYRRLARATHPDVSDAPDASARFAALTTAYRRALVLAGSHPSTGHEPPMARSVRITVHSAPGGGLRRPWPPGAGGYAPTVLGAASFPGPPIVAGPVRVEAPRSLAGRRVLGQWGSETADRS